MSVHVYSVLVQDKYGTMILFTPDNRQFARGKRYLHIFTKIESIIFHSAPYYQKLLYFTFSYCLTCIVAAFSEWQLNGLYLLWHSWQHSLLQTVELIKAAPGANLAETYKDTAHGLGKKIKDGLDKCLQQPCNCQLKKSFAEAIGSKSLHLSQVLVEV